MHITPLQPQDRAAVEELSQLAGTAIDVDRELGRPWADLWVARLDEETPHPTGFLLAWRVADEMQLLDIVTHPAARRRGVARALMQALVTAARRRAARRILLEVRRGNGAALGLYRSLGFRELRVRHGYYQDGEDALELALDLQRRGDEAAARTVRAP